jgi:hypothetical protein
MPRDNIPQSATKKLQQFFTKTLGKIFPSCFLSHHDEIFIVDTNNDGLVNWTDFEAAIESIVSKDEAAKNARLKVLRKRLEQHFQKYFWDLCAVGDANKDGNIDLGLFEIIIISQFSLLIVFHRGMA